MVNGENLAAHSCSVTVVAVIHNASRVHLERRSCVVRTHDTLQGLQLARWVSLYQMSFPLAITGC